MTLASRILLTLAAALLLAPSAFSQTSKEPLTKEAFDQQMALAKAGNQGTSGSGVGMGLAIVGAGIGLGLIGFSALSGIARQPEQAGQIQGVMYVMAALVEGAAIIALLLCFLVAARIMG
jgi:F-type H+-transporting ATPase subunit c